MLKLLRLAYFYVGIAFTATAVLPVFILRPFNPKNTAFFFTVFKYVMSWPLGLSYEEIDGHIVDETRPAIVAGNHQHNFDAFMASLALNKRIVFLGKKELLHIPGLGFAFYLGGNILVDRGNREKAMRSLEKVKRKLIEKDLNVGIFPEGTRNPELELLPFKMGAFHTAIQTQLPIVPYAVSHYAKNMNLNKLKSGKIVVKFLPAISTEGMTSEDAPRLAQMTRDAIQNALAEIDQKM